MSELALKLIAENKRTHATFLDLGNCGLTEIPPEIADLLWLQSLSLASHWWDGEKWHRTTNKTAENIIIDISLLSALTQLLALYVSNTEITDFSPLSALTQLQTLNIRDTEITDLSPLSALTRLQILDVSYTEITDLSPLSALTRLHTLYVDNTKINDLSPLSALTQLQILEVDHTQITDLSPLLAIIKTGVEVKWSSEYWQGEGIYVENCPLTNPPIAIVQQGNAPILNYFEEIANGTDYLYEAKLLLVGAGGAGKTSLVRRLYEPNKPLPTPDEITKGIDIYCHEFTIWDSRYPDGRPFRLNVWDFAGQDKYRPTDTFFFSQRSLYVLLDDTRNDDKTVHDAGFKYWLEAVDFFSDHSPVLIFQNERAGRSKDIDFAGIHSKFKVKDLYKGDLKNPKAVDSLRAAIEFYAKQLPHIGEALPAKWLKVRADIENLAGTQATLDLKDYFALYEKYLPSDHVKALHLSRYLHDLGVFLHYQDDDLLRRTVILQNEWATEAVFKMLDDETVKTQLGRFTAADGQRVWQASEYAALHPELRALMEKFELCYLLPDSQPKKWLAPQLLPASKPAELSDWATAGDLVLRYAYEFLPKGMISRLMVRLHRFVLRPELACLTGVLFERNSTQVLVELSSKGDEIVLRARGGVERKEFLSIIADDLDALNATFKGGTEKIKVLIPCCCDSCTLKTEPEFFEKERLLQRKKDNKPTIECPASYADVLVSQLLDGVQVYKMPNKGKEAKTNMKKLFISYSKHDNDYKITLIKHLAGLRDKIVTWNDRDLLAGEEWDKRIKEELYKADILLYLVSADSLESDYIQQIELPLIEQYCNVGKCRFVPIIIRACDWKEQGFAKYTVLPEKGKHIKSWVDEDEAWLNVVQGIKQVIALPT